MNKRLAAATLVCATGLLATACSNPPPNRMSRPQKVDVGTGAWCQTLADSPSLNPLVKPATAIMQDIITPSHGHNGIGLPIEGTRLEADIEAARAYNGNNQTAFLKAVQYVLSDCRYILGKQNQGG